LSQQIADSTPFTTGIALDYFGFGQEITALPADAVILGADWTEQLYTHPIQLEFRDSSGSTKRISILDCDLKTVPVPVDPLNISFAIDAGSTSWRFNYTVAPVPRITHVSGPTSLSVVRGYGAREFLDVVTEENIRFHLADGSALQGSDLTSPMGEDLQPFDLDQASSINWDQLQVDIQKEFGSAGSRRSIHEWLSGELLQTDASIVFYDHRPGECADFLTVTAEEGGPIRVALYHCKSSGRPEPGDRVDDLYDVCGQAVKSASYRILKRLVPHVKRRARDGSRFLRGTVEEFAVLMSADARYELPLEVVIVQPGLSRAAMSDKAGSLLTGVDRTIVALGCQRLKLLCS
jgi:hypothetical protein